MPQKQKGGGSRKIGKKRDQPTTKNYANRGSKAKNKERKANRRVLKLVSAATRCMSPFYTDPVTGKKLGTTSKVRLKMVEMRLARAARINMKRDCRTRMKEFRKTAKRKGQTAGVISPTVQGEKQFGPKADGRHLYQRTFHLAKAPTEAEWKQLLLLHGAPQMDMLIGRK